MTNLETVSESFVCPLCASKAFYFCSIDEPERHYFRCSSCCAVFLHPENYIDKNAEQERYETHNNDVDDPRYQKFVSPITDAVQQHFPKTAAGLDYGCGTGPVASKVLERKGFKEVALYDPFFQPHKKNLDKTYDYIICCEVMEHFFDPKFEFERLRKLLKKNGKLFCKTTILEEDISVEGFINWWYNKDPTHVFFYTENTLKFISKHFDFQTVKIEAKLITFG
ncbi:class I SAM-dependent methyltransferase [Psychroflexus aestuariivivens]|uniref:class I SAM-dependent methyltransferase n=1 Tax=Psychroflexus aestuariivivens TaxID=1795040 RepID=UPI000FDC300C|nr:class I SAM-dependent methyltransferase [Psychroflexus aestuariivivens]